MSTKRIQLPPVDVSQEKYRETEQRAEACGLTLSGYLRYRVYGKKVLTGEQLAAVREHEKVID